MLLDVDGSHGPLKAVALKVFNYTALPIINGFLFFLALIRVLRCVIDFLP